MWLTMREWGKRAQKVFFLFSFVFFSFLFSYLLFQQSVVFFIKPVNLVNPPQRPIAAMKNEVQETFDFLMGFLIAIFFSQNFLFRKKTSPLSWRP